MHTVMYGTEHQHNVLMQKKEGISVSDDAEDFQTFCSPVSLEWGTLMENVTVHILRESGFQDLHIDCVLDDECENLLFSPDMVALKDDRLVVVEIKSPFTRIPDGTVPFHYRAQLNAGMTVVKEADYCLFVDVVYRLCSLEQLMGPQCGYNRNFHKGKIVSGNAVSGGILVMVSDRDPISFCNKVLDAGGDVDMARQTLSFELRDTIVLWSPDDPFDKERVISVIMSVLVENDLLMQKEQVLVRVLPWKMYSWKETRHERNEDWCKKIRQYATNFFRTYSTRR